MDVKYLCQFLGTSGEVLHKPCGNKHFPKSIKVSDILLCPEHSYVLDSKIIDTYKFHHGHLEINKSCFFIKDHQRSDWKKFAAINNARLIEYPRWNCSGTDHFLVCLLNNQKSSNFDFDGQDWYK